MLSEARNIIIVGGIAAGMTAASRAKKLAPDKNIIVLEQGEFISYGACGMPYFISSVIKDVNSLIALTPESARDDRKIDLRMRSRVTGVDPENQTVYVEPHGASPYAISYDALVLATGAHATRPPVPGVNLPGVFTLRTLNDGIALRQFVDGQKPHDAVVVGAGAIGLEMAEALVALGSRVTLMEMKSSLMDRLDADMMGAVSKEVLAHGVQVLLDTPLLGIEKMASGRLAVTAGQASSDQPLLLESDMVVIATGIRPGGDIAKASGIAVDHRGAIVVDRHLATSASGVFAAGDCAQTFNVVTGENDWIPGGSTANKQGRVAGENAGGGDAVFKGVVGTLAAKVFDLDVALTGLSERAASVRGMKTVAVRIESRSRASYYPGASRLVVKLIAEENGRVIGAQMLGPGAPKRIDAVAVALHMGASVSDLVDMDLAYSPPYAPVWEALLIAANELQKKVRK